MTTETKKREDLSVIELSDADLACAAGGFHFVLRLGQSIDGQHWRTSVMERVPSQPV
jgi:hypothetical protein